MSNYRERARAVKEAGIAERDNFVPPTGPLNVYKYWAARSKHVPVRENFCHFWRVVAFWAPFMAVRRGVANVVETKAFVVVAIAVALALFAYSFTVGSVGVIITFTALSLLALAWLITGIAVGTSVVWENLRLNSELDRIDRALFWVTLPISYPLSLFTRMRYKNTKRFDENVVKVFVGLILLLAAAAIGLALVSAFMSIGFWLFVILAAGALITFGLIKGLPVLADYIRGKRKIAEEEAAIRDEERPVGPVVIRENKPSRFKVWLRNVGDFIIFAAQVARVKKWKICPIVEIEERDVA